MQLDINHSIDYHLGSNLKQVLGSLNFLNIFKLITCLIQKFIVTCRPGESNHKQSTAASNKTTTTTTSTSMNGFLTPHTPGTPHTPSLLLSPGAYRHQTDSASSSGPLKLQKPPLSRKRRWVAVLHTAVTLGVKQKLEIMLCYCFSAIVRDI